MLDKKEDILMCGRELFGSKGFKDTNVADITKMAGIGVGTFYNYYPSKEKLFLEIYLEENVKLKRMILEAVDMDDNPLKVIKEILSLNISGMESNPILKQWYNKDVFSKIERLYREENGNIAVDFVFGSVLESIKKWQSEGKMRSDIDCELIMAIFTALMNIDTHKEEIGIQYFPRIFDYLVEFVIEGLSDCSKQE